MYPFIREQIRAGSVEWDWSTGKHAPIAAEDQARFIAAVLQNPAPHVGETYPLYGPKEYTAAELFAEISRVLGREVKYTPLPDSAFKKKLSGLPQGFAQHVEEVTKDHTNGIFAGTDSVIKRVSAEEKLRKDKIRGSQRAYATHYAVGRQVRDAMLKISGIAPEDLPVVESIRHAEKRLRVDPSEPKLSAQLLEAATPSTAKVPAEDRHPINLRADLWKFALLVMATKPTGEISTSDLIAELPKYIQVPEESQDGLTGRSDNKFSQLVRNLKSHKTAKTNFIYQGYAESIPDGFRITTRGREFVKTYFSGA